MAGRPIDVAVTVANVGARQSPPSRLGFYLSTDSAILPDDLSIGGPCEVPPLSPGATVSCRGELLLPFVPAGTYHVGAIVDDMGAVVESDETNNARSADGGAIAIDVRCAAISAASRLFFEPGGTGTLAVTASADCSWTAVSDAGWLTVTSDASGLGNGTVAYTVAGNPVAIDRAATLVIGDNVFAVSQRAATCNYYFLSYHGGSLSDPAGGVGDFGVTTLEGCAWTAQSGASWLTITAGSPGVGPGQADLSTAPNPTFQSRTAMVTLAGHTVSVTQAGMPCVYSVSPPGSSFLPAGGSSTVAVTSQAGCAWTAGSDAPWAVIGASSGGGSGNGVVAYSVAANSSVSARTATLAIAGQAVAVTQTGCSSTLSSTSKSAPAAGGDESITVTVSAACTWTTQSGAGWYPDHMAEQRCRVGVGRLLGGGESRDHGPERDVDDRGSVGDGHAGGRAVRLFALVERPVGYEQRRTGERRRSHPQRLWVDRDEWGELGSASSRGPAEPARAR